MSQAHHPIDVQGTREALAGVLWCERHAVFRISRQNGNYDITVWPLGDGTGFVRVDTFNNVTVLCYSWAEVYAILNEPAPPQWAQEIRSDLRARSNGGKWT